VSDHPSSSNVFQLKAAASPAADQLQGTRAHALQVLPPILSAVLAGADDALFDLVQKSHSTFEQQQFFEAMRELRRQRGGIEQRYREHLISAFAGLEKRKPLVAHYAQPGETSNELSLLDEEELEEQLASEQVAQAIERKHAPILSKLDSQFSQLAGGIEINGRLSPVGPGHMAQSLRAGLHGCDLAASARLVLFKLYEQALLPALADFYAEMSKRLAANGVAGIAQKVTAAPAPAPAPQPAPPLPRREDSHIRDELFVALHGLLEDYRAAQRAAGNGYAGMEQARANLPPLAPGESLPLLSRLQRELPESVHQAVADPKQSLAAQIKRELMAQAENMGVGQPGAPLAAQDEDAIDLVGMLFEVLLNERKFEDKVRRVFTQMIVPYTKVAMLDRRVFMHKTHPARRMLNAVAEACDGNKGETALERELLERVQGLVERLVAEFNEDLAIFEALQEEFNGFLEQHRKRVELAERRAAEAQRGRERLEQARAVAAMELAMLMGAREAPSAIADLLRRYWTHHLALVILRDGTESDRFAQARASGEQLWRIMLECESGKPRTVPLAPLLEPVLASSGVTGPAATETIGTIEVLLDAMRVGDRSAIAASALPATTRHATPETQDELPPAPEPFFPTGHNVVSLRPAYEADPSAPAMPVEPPAGPKVTERGVAAHFASFWSNETPADAAGGDISVPALESVSTVPGATAGDAPRQAEEPAAMPAAASLEADAADLEKIRRLEVGSWVEMTGEDGTAQPAKLSWVSPISNRMLFVNRRGMRVCAVSAEELAVMLKQGKLSLREIDTAFERAMSQVLGKLRDTQGQKPATH
jgi:hypothetical protein